jgi:hypothetical protein
MVVFLTNFLGADIGHVCCCSDCGVLVDPQFLTFRGQDPPANDEPTAVRSRPAPGTEIQAL